MANQWLDENELDELISAMTAAGLEAPALRPLLFQQVHSGWVGALALIPMPTFQIRTDIMRLNTQGVLTDGVVPMVLYLRNGAKLAEASGHQTEGDVIRGLHDKVARLVTGAPRPRLPLPASQEEVVVGVADFLPVSYLGDGARLARAVGRVEVQKVFGGEAQWLAQDEPLLGLGTGWLPAPGMMLTCHHVIAARAEDDPALEAGDWRGQALGAKIRFDYDFEGASGNLVGVEEVLAEDEELDYALLRLKDVEVGRGWFEHNTVIPFKSAANVIQHPDGRTKEVVVRNNQVHQSEGHSVQYFSDTEPGSSGSPVCDDRWRVLALHTSSTRAPAGLQYQGKSAFYVNEGTNMDVIWKHFPDSIREAILMARSEEG